jgi:hypothetical protein
MQVSSFMLSVEGSFSDIEPPGVAAVPTPALQLPIQELQLRSEECVDPLVDKEAAS